MNLIIICNNHGINALFWIGFGANMGSMHMLCEWFLN